MVQMPIPRTEQETREVMEDLAIQTLEVLITRIAPPKQVGKKARESWLYNWSNYD